MKPIRNITDAKEQFAQISSALERLQDFFDRMSSAVEQVSAFQGDQPHLPEKKVPEFQTVVEEFETGMKQTTQADRVLKLLKEFVGAPVTTKFLTAEYRKRSLPGSGVEPIKLYNRISASLAYLVRRGDAVKNAQGFHAISQLNLPSVGERKAGT